MITSHKFIALEHHQPLPSEELAKLSQNLGQNIGVEYVPDPEMEWTKKHPLAWTTNADEIHAFWTPFNRQLLQDGHTLTCLDLRMIPTG